MTEIVVFAPAGVALSEALPGLNPAKGVTVVRWSGAPGTSGTTIDLRQGVLAARSVSILSATLAGRMLVRVLPLDPAVRFWRAVVRSDAAVAALGRAELLIAADRDGAYAAWQSVRARRRSATRSAPMAAVRGLPAAQAWLEGRSS